MRRNPATALRKDALYREIAGMLRSMPTGWRREYNKGRRALVEAGGPVLPDTPTPEQAMLLIGITAGGNPSGDTPYGPHEVPEEVRQAAMHGIRLSYREGYGAWMFIGLARAIELVIVPSVSDVTYSRMGKYLFRHAKDKRAARFGDDENPSNGYLAWLNWGGDPAAAWTRAVQRNPARKETYLEGVERREKKKGKGERAFDTAQTVGGLAVAGAKLGGRAIPVVGEVLMVAGAGKEAVKVARRRLKGGKGSWKSDLAKVGAGAFGLESFVPEAGAKPLKKNPAANVFGPKKPLFGPYTYRAKQNSNGDTLIAVYHGSKRIAHIDAFWAYSMRTIEEHEADEKQRGRGKRLVCASDLRALGAEGRYPNVLAVGHAFMDDDGYKGKGIGRAMYEAMMVEGFAVRQTRISGQPGPLFFIPDECKGAGNTSAEAQRVWASLARDYPSQGTSIRVDAPPVIGSKMRTNPRRIRNGTKAQARALIDAALCGDLDDDNFYHVTTESRLDAIARYGLESPLARLHREEPDIEPGSMLERVAISQRVRFGKMGEYSQDKVFVSHGLNTARIWADYIREMVDEDEQVVVLRIRPEAELYSKVYLDEKGTEDAGCSFYVTSTIKPQHLEVLSEEEEERLPRRRNSARSRRNPDPTWTAERTDPALWEAVKREVTAGSKGGRPGQWSARKAQLAVALYKQRGGDYWGPKSPRNALAKWTREDWRTRSGKPSLVTGERYLPARAIAALSPQEYAATTRAKREGMRRGEQFVAQPERIAAKTSRYRKNPGRC